MPVWNHQLQLADVFHDDDMPFEQKRDEIVKRIKASTFWDDNDLQLNDLVEELSDAENEDEFDMVWDSFYNYADAERIWVATF